MTKKQASKCDIAREVAGYAYPRNGNVHNPTPRYRWVVTSAGRLVGTTGTAKDACALADEFDKNPEW